MAADDAESFADVRESADGHPMKSLLRYCVPYWPRLSVGVAASVLTRLARLVPSLLVAAAIDRVVRRGGEPGLLAELGLLPSGAVTGRAARLGLLRQLVVIAALAYLVRSVARFAARYLLQSTAQKVQRDLRNDAYDHMQRLSLDFFENHQTGGMMSVLNSDVNRLERFLNTELRQVIRVVATVGGIAAIMFATSWRLALIALAPVPIIALASGKFLTWIEPHYRGIRETVARLNARLENNLGGVRVIKSFNRHAFERDRVADQSQAYHDEKVGAIKLRRAFFSALRLLTGVVFVGILWIGGSGVVLGRERALSAGGFALFFLLLRRLYSPMRRVGKTANKYQLAKSSAERVFGVLGREPTITSPADPHAPAAVDGDVTFDGVRFGYDENDVLRGVSLDVAAGETVGLAGTTGAGKSTLLQLLPRFYDTDEGAVRIDGVDVREWDVDRLRERVGIVEQNPYLFGGTAAENIAYGDRGALDRDRSRSRGGDRAPEGAAAGDPDGDRETPEASRAAGADGPGDGEGLRPSGSRKSSASGDDGTPAAPDDRIVAAAKAAEAHEFIADLPEGYETRVGERGVKLSGGQRQRIAIARALLNDPEIVILDEATSDVDTETEERIQESLDRLTEDRTAFVIAHRLSTLRDADRTVVMEDGRIVERGDHASLLAEGGTYADLWRRQGDADGESDAAADPAESAADD